MDSLPPYLELLRGRRLFYLEETLAQVRMGEGLRRLRRYDLPVSMAADSRVGPAAKIVWMVLADLAFGCEAVYPGIEEIARRAGISSRSARDQVRELAFVGWLEVHERPGSTSIYVVHATDYESGNPASANIAANIAATSAHPGNSCIPTTANFAGVPRQDLPTSPFIESVQEREREQEPARARKSEERAENEIETPPPSGTRLQEWAATRPQVLADFRSALEREEWEPSRIDEAAAREASGLLSSLKDRRTQFTKALAVLDEDGRAHPHKLADVIQVLRNGDHERKRHTLDEHAARAKRLEEETERILAERRSWSRT